MRNRLYRQLLAPGLRLKRYMMLISVGAGFLFIASGIVIFRLFPQLWQNISSWAPANIFLIVFVSGLFLLIYGIAGVLRRLIELLGESSLEQKPVLSLAERLARQGGIKLTTIGGGTGMSTLLRGLKDWTENITAVVNTADDGGSSGKMRALNIPAPGDIRNCIVALADADEEVRKLFNYRYNGEDSVFSGIEGHKFGNIFLATLFRITQSFPESVQLACRILRVRGQVLPVTDVNDIQMQATLEDGTVITGESAIGKAQGRIQTLRIVPDCLADKDVLSAILNAELIVIGPGSLFTSIIATLLPNGIKEALAMTKAPIIYVANIMTENTETLGMTLSEHVLEMEKYMGDRKADIVLVNNKKPRQEVLDRYLAEEEARYVEDDGNVLSCEGRVVHYADLLDEDAWTTVRHDPKKVTKEIMAVYREWRHAHEEKMHWLMNDEI